jgi:TPR repeat protein
MAGATPGKLILALALAGSLFADHARAAETNAVPDAAAVAQLRAAARKDPKAQYQLGQLYLSGRGVPQNFQTAAEWFKQAADKDAAAQYTLGFCYASGTGVTKSMSRATAYYLDAARQGHAEAQFKVAVCYEKGLGVSRANAAEAAKWYRKAAEQGVVEAQNVLGNQARQAHNYTEAVKWYNLAAVRGLASAQYWLGISYQYGQGFEHKDSVEAYKWFSLSAQNGYEPANTALEDLPRLFGMTAEQVAVGKRRASELQDQLRQTAH